MNKIPAVLVGKVKTEDNNIQQFKNLRFMIMRLALGKTLQQSVKLIDHWFLNGKKKEKRYSSMLLLIACDLRLEKFRDD